MTLNVTVGDGAIGVTTSTKLQGAADGVVENTNQTFQDTVAPGGTLIIPDINITKNDDSVVTSPAAIDLDLRIIDPATAAPATWDEFVAEYGRGYEYPAPTGQGTSFRTGDDKDIEDTIFGATNRQTQTLKARNTLASFNVLNNNNSFGNTDRFTDDAGGQTYTSGVVIDNYTGLMWNRTLESTGRTWNETIDDALASTFASFSDWFLPNVNHYFSISDFGANAEVYLKALGNSTFSNSVSSSTTFANNSLNVFRVGNQFASLSGVAKTNTGSRHYFLRKHF